MNWEEPASTVTNGLVRMLLYKINARSTQLVILLNSYLTHSEAASLIEMKFALSTF